MNSVLRVSKGLPHYTYIDVLFHTLTGIVLAPFMLLAPVAHTSMVITCQRAGNISPDLLQNSCLIEDSQLCFGQPVIDNLTDPSLSFQSIHGTLLKDSLTPDGLTDREYLDHKQYQSSPVVAVSEKVPEASTSKLLTAIPFSALALTLTYASISHSPEYKIPKLLAHTARAAAMNYAMRSVIDFDTETLVQNMLLGIGPGMLMYAIAREVLCIRAYLSQGQVLLYEMSDFDPTRAILIDVIDSAWEEIIHRGILQNGLDFLFVKVLGYFEVEDKRERAELASSLLSSSLFAATHLRNDGYSSLKIAITWYGGYILGDIHRRHGLLSAMSFHSFFNLANVALSLTYLKWLKKIRQGRQ